MHSWIPPFSNTHFLPQGRQKQLAIMNQGFAFAVKRIPPLQAPSNKDLKPHGHPGDVFCQRPPPPSPFPLHPHMETAPFLVGCTKNVVNLGKLQSPSFRIDIHFSEPPITVSFQNFNKLSIALILFCVPYKNSIHSNVFITLLQIEKWNL